MYKMKFFRATLALLTDNVVFSHPTLETSGYFDIK